MAFADKLGSERFNMEQKSYDAVAWIGESSPEETRRQERSAEARRYHAWRERLERRIEASRLMNMARRAVYYAVYDQPTGALERWNRQRLLWSWRRAGAGLANGGDPAATEVY